MLKVPLKGTIEKKLKYSTSNKGGHIEILCKQRFNLFKIYLKKAPHQWKK